MPTESSTRTYALGSTSAEHQHLLRQAAIFDQFTERFFREAGLVPGQRVLDIGAGLGDVSMLAARLVGTSGAVIGVDNDPGILDKARARIAEAGFENVTLIESDVGNIPAIDSFDAIVGRLILEFLPNPRSVVSSLVRALRPGGTLAIQDAYWSPFLQLSNDMPVRSKCATLIYEAFQRSGTNMEMERVLYRSFQEAGLPPPKMRIEVPVGSDPELARWTYDLLCSLLPRMVEGNLSIDSLGDTTTLRGRLEAELASNKMFSATIGLVGAWSRKPRG